jgi:ADP-ribose pyrophosphatase YjhB (NUDIX family)
MSLLTTAVAAVIRDSAGNVLLCQQSQGHRLWGLPGGRIRNGESPVHAVIRDVREETGTETEVIDLVGLYQLTGDACGELPDVLVHVFRGRVDGDISVNSPGRISRLAWYDPAHLPDPLTATARAALGDVLADRSGVVRDVQRDTEPDVPDAADPVAEPLAARTAADDDVLALT